MTNSKSENATAKAPSHIAYQVRDNADKAFWTRIGAAWAHKDGNGFNIQLDAIPFDREITLRVFTSEEK